MLFHNLVASAKSTVDGNNVMADNQKLYLENELDVVVEKSTDQCLRLWKSPDQVSHCCDTVYLTECNPYLVVSHCYNLDKQDVCPYLVMFFFQLVQRTDRHSR